MMVATTLPTVTIAICDPLSTGACVAVEAVSRGYNVIAVWTHGLSEEFKAFLPECAHSLEFYREVDEVPSLEETVEAVRAACGHFYLMAVICGAETGVALADKLSAEGVAYKLWVEQPEGIPTAIALKPYPRSRVAPLLKKYNLFK